MFQIDPKRVVAEYVGNNGGSGDRKLTALAQKKSQMRLWSLLSPVW